MNLELFKQLLRLEENLLQENLTPAERFLIETDLVGARNQYCLESNDAIASIYEWNDSLLLGVDDPLSLNQEPPAAMNPLMQLQTLEELLERDGRRQEDGFPRKVILGKIASPRGRKSVIVPTVTEEKFYHDNRPKLPGESGDAGGSGDGEEGEVIGEQPVKPEQGQGAGAGPGGDGDGESHELDDSRAFEIGKALTEHLQLPNIEEKGKKSSLFRYTYELTDINRGFGQILEKKRSLKNVIRTNLMLGTFDLDDVNFDKMIIAPNDLVYRIVSPEKEYESQALVFFIRDYSGSMYGETTEVVLNQHVLIYSWLLYQYRERVEKRFILHDTNAREVDNFVTYYRLNNGGGTTISAAYKLVNKLIEEENLADNYNIYIFQGTDGDDWDTNGKEALPEIEKLLKYVNRMGITVVHNRPNSGGGTTVEKYLESSGLLKKHPDLIRLSVLESTNQDQDALIKSIKELVS